MKWKNSFLIFACSLLLLIVLFLFNNFTLKTCSSVQLNNDESQSNSFGLYYDAAPSTKDELFLENSFDYSHNTFKNMNFSTNIQTSEQFNGDSFVPNHNFLSAYYSHLSNNMPLDHLGICGYTGISMLLSFYDTYWNDGFIPEIYDSPVTKINSIDLYSSSTNQYESPGVSNNLTWNAPGINNLRNEIIESGITDTESTEFSEALDRLIMREINNQINSQTFLGYLFEIALANGSIKPHFIESEYHNVANADYLTGIGVSYKIVSSVLSDYIKSNDKLNGKISVITSELRNKNDKERLRNEIVSIVNSGRPVLMGGGQFTDLNNNGVKDSDEERGHVVVAYEYDSEKDILYGNMGWSNPNQSHVNLDEYFNIQISDYWALNIGDLRQERTNNYIFTDKKAYYSPGINKLFNVITPKDYGFLEEYGDGTSPIENVVKLPKTQERIITNRLRCGFIEEQCINISPKRYENGLAYLEYVFDKEISKIEVDISWWSRGERVNKHNSDYKIEHYNSKDNCFYESLDLWNDIDLSTNRLNPSHFSVYFAPGVKGFRFYGHSSDPLNDRNKGRLSIFNIIVEYINE